MYFPPELQLQMYMGVEQLDESNKLNIPLIVICRQNECRANDFRTNGSGLLVIFV